MPKCGGGGGGGGGKSIPRGHPLIPPEINPVNDMHTMHMVLIIVHVYMYGCNFYCKLGVILFYSSYKIKAHNTVIILCTHILD